MTPLVHGGLRAFSMRRRMLMAASAGSLSPALAVLPAMGHAQAHAQANAQARGDDRGFAAAVPRPLVFPADHGAHPAYRIEWWYLTAVLSREPDSMLGVQVTFFRVRTPIDVDHPQQPSRFTARQLLVAHAAIADPKRGSLLHEQRIARVGPGGTSFEAADTALALDRWSLRRTDAAAAVYTCELPARSFTLRFTATARKPLLLHGQAGTLRKSPRGDASAAASHYYSSPQLALDATLERDGRREQLGGTGWLDHEWSSTLLDPEVAGWDWTGMNFDDGGALMAYHFRRRGDGKSFHSHATWRDAAGTVRSFGPNEVVFTPLEHWESPRTRGRYPVALRIQVGDRTFETRPLMADQELDSRATTGQVYWEGASTLLEGGRAMGRGYVELTGYAAPMNL